MRQTSPDPFSAFLVDEATLQGVEQWVLKAKHDFQSAKLLMNNDALIRDTGVYPQKKDRVMNVKEKLLLIGVISLVRLV